MTFTFIWFEILFWKVLTLFKAAQLKNTASIYLYTPYD